MLSFQEFILESSTLHEVKRHTKVKDWVISMTKHAMDRVSERRKDLDQSDWRSIYQSIVKKAEKTKLPEEVLFYSRKLQQGIVVALDYFKQTIRIITTLPQGKKFAKPGTEKVVVEGKEFSEMIDLED